MKTAARVQRLEDKLAKPKAKKPMGPMLFEDPDTRLFKHEGKTYTLEEVRAAFPENDYSTPPIFVSVVRTREEAEDYKAAQRKATP